MIFFNIIGYLLLATVGIIMSLVWFGPIITIGVLGIMLAVFLIGLGD